MANSRDNSSLSGDYTILWVHPEKPEINAWDGSHNFDACIRTMIMGMVKRQGTDVYDFDNGHESDSQVTTRTVINKIKKIQPHLIMFFDEFSQWNVKILHAIRTDKEITKSSYQILSYPTLSIVLSNF